MTPDKQQLDSQKSTLNKVKTFSFVAYTALSLIFSNQVSARNVTTNTLDNRSNTSSLVMNEKDKTEGIWGGIDGPTQVNKGQIVVNAFVTPPISGTEPINTGIVGYFLVSPINGDPTYKVPAYGSEVRQYCMGSYIYIESDSELTAYYNRGGEYKVIVNEKGKEVELIVRVNKEIFLPSVSN